MLKGGGGDNGQTDTDGQITVNVPVNSHTGGRQEKVSNRLWGRLKSPSGSITNPWWGPRGLRSSRALMLSGYFYGLF